MDWWWIGLAVAVIVVAVWLLREPDIDYDIKRDIIAPVLEVLEAAPRGGSPVKTPSPCPASPSPVPQEETKPSPDTTKPPLPNARWKRQEKIHMIVEKLTGRKFLRNQRPPFLRNPETGRCLELDTWDGDKLAVEYQGIQHYKFPNPFHKTEEEFRKQVRRDQIKAELCRQLGIHLIRVPYHVPDNELEDYINRRLPENWVPSEESIER